MGATPSKQPTRRHCMVVHAVYPRGETRVERQAQALLEHGFEVDVICLRLPDDPAQEVVDGVRVHRLPVRRRKTSSSLVLLLEYLSFFILALIHLTRLHLQRRYNTVQVHNLPDFLVLVALVPKLTGASVILDLHDLMPEFYVERFGRSMDSPPLKLIRAQEWLSCRFANHIITVTEPWRQALVQRGQPANKVSVVMNVADDHIFNRDVEADRTNGDPRFKLIYHGSLNQRQGLDVALRAIDLARQTIPGIHLTLHGGGDYRPNLMRLTDDLGLQDYVEFDTHFVPTPELPKLLKRADLALVPYHNGVFSGGILPTKLMEYAALGIPAIAARTPGIAAYFDETMVQFFTPDDIEGLAHCILALHADRERLAQLAQGSGKFTECYNWTRLGAEYVALVKRLSKQ